MIKSISMIGLVFTLAMVGCGGGSEEPAAAEAPAAAATAAPAAGGGGGGGVCARAAECCAAYIEAMGAGTPGMNADQVCAGVRQAGTAGAAGEPACTAAVNAWKQSLQAMSKPIPAACN